MKDRFSLKNLANLLSICTIACLIFTQCSDGDDDTTTDLSHLPYNPVPYIIEIPAHFPQMAIPQDNPMTQEGVALGRRLFYDPLLSSDNSMSCSSCHLPEGSFTDNLKVSEGVTGMRGRRSSMSLLNIGFNNNGLFWDGRVANLEEQALLPVEDSIELHNNWEDVELELRASAEYPTLFRGAFGIHDKEDISRNLVVKAIAQFERILISSGMSKYDRVITGLDVFTDEELLGHNIFFDIEEDVTRHAECGHCHNAPLFSTNEYFNNGIDSVDSGNLTDIGRAEFTSSTFDIGKFRVPTLRNILQSAPYMHDGRFGSLEEVIDHYDQHVKKSLNLDPNLRQLNISPEDRAALVAFIKTLEDPVFTADERFSSPF